MRDWVRSVLQTRIGKFGAFLLVFKPLWDVISFLGDVSFVVVYITPTLSLLETGWGTLLIALIGLGLIYWASTRQSGSDLSSSSSAHDQQSQIKADPVPQQEAEWLKTRADEIEQERDALKTTVEQQQERLSRYDGNRAMLKDLLTEAWNEGMKLRESKPSKEEARDWENYVSDLLEQAVGREIAEKVLRHDPEYQSGDLDATDIQMR